jgi:hypothetical protein
MKPDEEYLKKCLDRLSKQQGSAPPPNIYPNANPVVSDKEDYRFALEGKTEWKGIKISIENKKGSVRSGTDENGKPWEIKMKHAYGRIPRTEGNDGDNVDVIIGPDLSSDLVFIVHQTTPWTKGWDEDKCIIGAKTQKQAESIFKSMYNQKGFMGPIDVVSSEVFKEMLKKSKKGKPLGSSKVTDARIRDSITNLALGILVEMEHTDDVREAEKIATDHLSENSNYYLNPRNHFLQEVHKEIMALAKESERVRGKDKEVEFYEIATPEMLRKHSGDKDYKSRLNAMRERRAWTDDKGRKHYDMDEQGNLVKPYVADAEVFNPEDYKKNAKRIASYLQGKGWKVKTKAVAPTKMGISIYLDIEKDGIGFNVRVSNHSVGARRQFEHLHAGKDPGDVQKIYKYAEENLSKEKKKDLQKKKSPSEQEIKEYQKKARKWKKYENAPSHIVKQVKEGNIDKKKALEIAGFWGMNIPRLKSRMTEIADASPLTELALTPLIKKLMAKIGFNRMRWIGRGWFVPISAGQYGKFLTQIPMLKLFDTQLNRFGYHIRINPLGFFIEPVAKGNP